MTRRNDARERPKRVVSFRSTTKGTLSDSGTSSLHSTSLLGPLIECWKQLSFVRCHVQVSEMPHPFHSSHHGQQQLPNPATGIFSAAGALGSIAAPGIQRLASGTTSAGTDTLLNSNEAMSYGNDTQQQNNMAQPYQPNRTSYHESGMPVSAPATAIPSQGQQFSTPRRTHTQRQSQDLHIPSNAPSLQYAPQHQQMTYDSPATYANQQPPAFNIQQATPQGSHSSSILPSNVPSALQPASGSRPAASSAYTAPTTVPTMAQQPPIQTNAQQYTQAQPLSRSNTLHAHSRSSPAGMQDGPQSSQKYIPFNQTPTQTPTAASNPKAYNLNSAAPAGLGTSHSPLNLGDIRSRTVSDSQNETGMGTNTLFAYSDAPTNSNYLAPFATYAYDWCKWPVMSGSSAGKMAVGSYLEDPHNFIQILDTQITPQETGGYGLEYTKVAEATCAYPVTRILWEPPSSQKQSTDLLATSGDHLRLWSLPGQASTPISSNINNRQAQLQQPQKLQPLALLSNSKTPEHTAPLTSLDWNTLSPKLIITSSIDTTCTIWDIPTLTAKTQLIAHDKEVFDVRFCAGSVDVFVSCGADGSVRMFDLRSLEHSTIIYEPSEKGDKGTPGKVSHIRCVEMLTS